MKDWIKIIFVLFLFVYAIAIAVSECSDRKEQQEIAKKRPPEIQKLIDDYYEKK